MGDAFWWFEVFSPAIPVLLNRRAFNASIAAKHTTISWFRLQDGPAIFTLVKILAGLCGHGFFPLVPADWARNGRL